MANRVFIDIKEDTNGHMTGTIKFSKDSTFVFEVLAEVIDEFSKSCEIPPEEIAADLLAAVFKQQEIVVQ